LALIQRIRSVETIPWIKANSENRMVGWNYLALGGNDNFRPYPAEQLFEDWYAFDDLVVRNDIPASLGTAPVSSLKAPPSAPSTVTVD